ncbi:unnamed protein product, partial [Brenthis ino]
MDADDRTLLEVLSFITSTDITISDKYPKQVCNDCFITMCKADEFKKRCLQSENLLKSELFHTTFQDLTKHEPLTNFDTLKSKSIIENQEHGLFNFLNNQSKEEEINSDNMSDMNYRYDGLRAIKEEHDDFLQDDMDDLAESIVIESKNVPNTKIDSSFSKICGCEFVCADQCKLETHMRECKHLVNKCDVTEENGLTHFEKELTDEKNEFFCPVCGERFEYRSIYTLHLNTHKKKVKVKDKKIKKNQDKKDILQIALTCSECKEECPDMHSLKKHLNKHKTDGDTEDMQKYQCSMCMRQFTRKFSLIAHFKKHEDKARKIFTCKACKREFQHQAHLDNHIVLVHSKDKGFTCNKCNKSFTTQDCLDHHVEGHKLPKKHQCTVCNKTFTMLSTLTEHMRTHTGEKPFLCSICGKGFSQKNNLAQHMRRHQGLKPFKCEHCERRFVSKGELEAHNRKHSGAHPFVCDECGNSFTTSSSLTKHRRIHSGERPYACDLCSMRFAALGTLKNHRRTHTGEKPYQCSHCEKAFIQRNDLVSHIRCHTGERPYICTYCGQGFRKASALKVHLKIHGKDTTVI